MRWPFFDDIFQWLILYWDFVFIGLFILKYDYNDTEIDLICNLTFKLCNIEINCSKIVCIYVEKKSTNNEIK